jgi:polysaccharide transporter, PST family
MRVGAGSPPGVNAAVTEIQDDIGLTLRGFVQTAGLMSLSSLANIFRGLVSAKVIAVTLGPTPVGILSQLLNLSAFLMTVVPLGLTTGVAKMIAEGRDAEEEVNRVVGTALALAVVSGITVAVAAAPLAMGLSGVLTGSRRYAPFLLILLATLPLSNFGGVVSYILQGLVEVRRLTWVNVSVAIGSLVLTVPAAFLFGLPGVVGAIFGSSLLQVIASVVALRAVYRAHRWQLSALTFSMDHAKTLLSYGSIMLIGGIGMFGSVLVVRTDAVRELGNFQNGIYQFAYTLSSQYMTIFMAWMSAYVFPQIAAQKDERRLGPLLNFGLVSNLYLVVAIIALREPLIRLLFSAAFLPAASLVPSQVLGDYLRIIGWSFGVVLFARGLTRLHLAVVLAQSVGWVLISVPLMTVFGLRAVVLGYALSCLTWPLLMYPMARRRFGVRVSAEGAALAMLGVVLLLGATLLPWTAGVVLALVMPALLLYKQRHTLIARLGT